MSNHKKGSRSKPFISSLDPEYNDMISIMESDLEDYEIAAELGISPSRVSVIRREIFED